MTTGSAFVRSVFRGLRTLSVAAAVLNLAAHVQAEDAPEAEEFSTRIFVSNLDGTGLKPLTDLPDIQTQGSPEWSGNGALVAFDGWRSQKGETGQSARIIVVNADGTNPRFYGDGAMPSFSPKGNRIAYSRYGKGVWLTNVNDDDGQPIPLDEAGWGTSWSPDGRQIAYTRNYNTIVVFDVVEGTTVNLFDARSPYRQIAWNFAWAPDGKKIGFQATLATGKKAVVTVDARGAKHGLDVLYEGTALPALCWSANSQQVLFAETAPERDNIRLLFAVGAAPGATPQLLKGLPEDRQLSDPSISPDGKKIAFAGTKRIPKPAK